MVNNKSVLCITNSYQKIIYDIHLANTMKPKPIRKKFIKFIIHNGNLQSIFEYLFLFHKNSFFFNIDRALNYCVHYIPSTCELHTTDNV